MDSRASRSSRRFALSLGAGAGLVDIGIAVGAAHTITQLWDARPGSALNASAALFATAFVAATLPLVVSIMVDSRSRLVSRGAMLAMVEAALSGRVSVGDLVVRGSAVADSRRDELVIDTHTGALASIPLAALLIAVFVTPWVLAITAGLLAVSVPLYIWAGRASARERAAHLTHEADSVTRWSNFIEASPALRGIHRLDIGLRELAGVTLREMRSADRAISRALASSAISEFVAGVAVGLVAMVIGFGLFHKSRAQLFPAIAAVLLTAHIASVWRQRGADFHAREEVVASLAILNTPTLERVGSEGVETRDLVALPGATPITVTIRRGAHVHLVGASGAGKSSLIDVLVGHRAPAAGDIRGLLGERVGLVNPFIVLTGTTMDEVICAGQPLDSAPFLNMVGLDYLDAHAEGVVDNLSDGERVRVLLARALAHDCDALVIDDVMGLLDDVAGAQCRNALASLAGDITVIEAGHGPWLTTPSQVVELSL
jgi:ABC-type transport system involved in cytochrome bd biosynthesis fused ATPase/permease subunit